MNSRIEIRIMCIFHLTSMRINAYGEYMTAREVLSILERAGFVNKGGKGHDKLEHPDGRITVVHRHKGDIPPGTLRAIERQSGVKLS